MSRTPLSIMRVGTVVLPVADQTRALVFYTDVLGMRKVSDFTYATGERWLEVSPGVGSANLCLVAARTDQPSGVDTGIVLLSADISSDYSALRERGVDVDDALLAAGELVWWSGAPLAGVPPQFRLRDPDGNSLLIVAST